MASFEGVLAGIPGYGGYLAKRQYNEQSGLSDLKTVSGVLGLQDALETRQQKEAVKGVLSSSPDIQTALPQLVKLGPLGVETAKTLIGFNKEQATADAMTSLTKGDINNPDAVERLGLITNHAGLLTMADRQRKQAADRSAFTALQPTEQPIGATPMFGTDRVLRANMDSEDAAKNAALDAAAKGQRVSIGVGQSTDPAENVQTRGGAWGTLMNSTLPEIRDAAFQANDNMVKSNALATPPAHIVDAVNRLQGQEGQRLNARAMLDTRNNNAREMVDYRNANRVPLGSRLNANGELERIPVAGAESAANDAALTDDAWFSIINGKARPGSLPIGRDEGNRYREQLRNKISSIAAEMNLSPQQLATLGPENKAKFSALSKVEADLAAIRPFDVMLNTNAKIAVDLAKKISADRSNSQLLNKPITWLEANAGDNPDIAEYLFQIQTVKTEGARILNNPRLVGQLTDSARSEMGGVINGNMPLGQTERVLARMIADGKNRVNAIEQEADTLRNDIRGSASKKGPSAPSNPLAPFDDAEKERRYQEWKRNHK